MLFQKAYSKATASTCHFQCGIYYCSDIAIISALRKPHNFPILLFFLKQPTMLLREAFFSLLFLLLQTKADVTGAAG